MSESTSKPAAPTKPVPKLASVKPATPGSGPTTPRGGAATNDDLRNVAKAFPVLTTDAQPDIRDFVLGLKNLRFMPGVSKCDLKQLFALMINTNRSSMGSEIFRTFSGYLHDNSLVETWKNLDNFISFWSGRTDTATVDAGLVDLLRWVTCKRGVHVNAQSLECSSVSENLSDFRSRVVNNIPEYLSEYPGCAMAIATAIIKNGSRVPLSSFVDLAKLDDLDGVTAYLDKISHAVGHNMNDDVRCVSGKLSFTGSDKKVEATRVTKSPPNAWQRREGPSLRARSPSPRPSGRSASPGAGFSSGSRAGNAWGQPDFAKPAKPDKPALRSNVSFSPGGPMPPPLFNGKLTCVVCRGFASDGGCHAVHSCHMRACNIGAGCYLCGGAHLFNLCSEFSPVSDSERLDNFREFKMGSGSGGPSIKRLRVQNCAVKQCVAGPVPRSGVSPAGCDSKSEINLISKPEALRACVLLDLDPAEAITAGDPIRVHDFTNAPRGIWRERIHLPVRSLGTQEFLVVGSGPGDKIETLLGQPALKEAALSRSLLRIGDTCYPLRLWNWHDWLDVLHLPGTSFTPAKPAVACVVSPVYSDFHAEEVPVHVQQARARPGRGLQFGSRAVLRRKGIIPHPLDQHPASSALQSYDGNPLSIIKLHHGKTGVPELDILAHTTTAEVLLRHLRRPGDASRLTKVRLGCQACSLEKKRVSHPPAAHSPYTCDTLVGLADHVKFKGLSDSPLGYSPDVLLFLEQTTGRFLALPAPTLETKNLLPVFKSFENLFPSDKTWIWKLDDAFDTPHLTDHLSTQPVAKRHESIGAIEGLAGRLQSLMRRFVRSNLVSVDSESAFGKALQYLNRVGQYVVDKYQHFPAYVMMADAHRMSRLEQLEKDRLARAKRNPPPHSYRVGDLVWRYQENAFKGKRGGWVGPYVVAVVGEHQRLVLYPVSDEGSLERRRRTGWVHAADLQPWAPGKAFNAVIPALPAVSGDGTPAKPGAPCVLDTSVGVFRKPVVVSPGPIPSTGMSSSHAPSSSGSSASVPNPWLSPLAPASLPSDIPDPWANSPGTPPPVASDPPPTWSHMPRILLQRLFFGGPHDEEPAEEVPRSPEHTPPPSRQSRRSSLDSPSGYREFPSLDTDAGQHDTDEDDNLALTPPPF